MGGTGYICLWLYILNKAFFFLFLPQYTRASTFSQEWVYMPVTLPGSELGLPEEAGGPFNPILDAALGLSQVGALACPH